MSAIEDEIEELWRRHAGEVRRFLHSRCGDVELAEDLTNETFALASRDRRDRVLTVGWLMTVARRRLIDHWRRSARHRAYVEHVSHEPSRVTSDFDEIPGLWLDHADLHDALGKLCMTQRQALVLRYCEEHTVEAVAETLNLSYRAAESVLARGRRNLRNSYAAVAC